MEMGNNGNENCGQTEMRTNGNCGQMEIVDKGKLTNEDCRQIEIMKYENSGKW